MAVTFHTLTGNLRNLLGASDRHPMRARIETNLPKGTPLVAGGEVRLGDGSVAVDQSAGTFTVSPPASDSADLNVDPGDTLQYRLVVEYGLSSTGERRTSGLDTWFELDGVGPTDLSAIIETAYLPASAISAAITTITNAGTLEVARVNATGAPILSAAQASAAAALVSETNAADISGIAVDDDIVEVLIQPGVAGPKTKAALNASYEGAVVLVGPGIDPTGVTDSTTGIRNRIAAGLAAGIRKFSAVPNATYKVNIVGSTHRQNLIWFTDLTDIQILGRGATIRDTTTYTADKLCNMFGFTRCTNIEVTGWSYLGEVVASPATFLGATGASFVYAEDGCRNIKVEARLTNARYGVRSGDYTQVAYGECRNFQVKVTGSMIGYPIAVTNGYNVNGQVDVDGFHRASYLAGVTGARLITRFKNWYGATIANLVTNGLTLYADDVNYADRTARGCKNIRVDSTDTGSTVFPTQSMCCGLGLQWVAEGTEFADVEFTFHVRSSDTVASTVGGFQLESTVKSGRTEYPFNWETFIKITDLRIRGDIDRTGQAVATNSLGEIFMRSYDSGDGGLTHIPTISKVDIQVTYKKGSVQTRPWFVELPGLIDTVVLDRVQAVGVPLVASAPTGTVSLRGGNYGAVSVTPSPHSLAVLDLSDGVVSTGVASARITRQRHRSGSIGFATALTETVQDALATTGTATVVGTGWLRKGFMVKGIVMRVSYAGAPPGNITIGIPGTAALFGTFTMVSGVNRLFVSTGLPYYPAVDTNIVVTFAPTDGVTFPNGPWVQLAVYAERFSVDAL